MITKVELGERVHNCCAPSESQDGAVYVDISEAQIAHGKKGVDDLFVHQCSKQFMSSDAKAAKEVKE